MKHDRMFVLPTLLFLIASSPAALADDVHCPAHLGPVTVDGNVLVAAPCRLEGTVVKGNVHLYAGGSLTARGEVRIDGSIQAENANYIDVAGARINGNIQLDNLVGDRSVIDHTQVGGSIQLKSNRSRLEVQDNTVAADVQAFSNTGGVVIAGNEIDGNLQCQSNNPSPAGANNRVQGNKEDQCANLTPEADAGNATPGATSVAPPGPAASDSSGGGGSFGLAALLLLALLRLSSERTRW